jgi:hypothetical protein
MLPNESLTPTSYGPASAQLKPTQPHEATSRGEFFE